MDYCLMSHYVPHHLSQRSARRLRLADPRDLFLYLSGIRSLHVRISSIMDTVSKGCVRNLHSTWRNLKALWWPFRNFILQEQKWGYLGRRPSRPSNLKISGLRSMRGALGLSFCPGALVGPFLALVGTFPWALVEPFPSKQSEARSERSAEFRGCKLHMTHTQTSTYHKLKSAHNTD